MLNSWQHYRGRQSRKKPSCGYISRACLLACQGPRKLQAQPRLRFNLNLPTFGIRGAVQHQIIMANHHQKQNMPDTTGIRTSKLRAAQFSFRKKLNNVAKDNQSLKAVSSESTNQFYSDLDIVFVQCTAENIQVSISITPQSASILLDIFFTSIIEMQRMDYEKHSPVHGACVPSW